jgi:8-oxoguanine deaminase
MIRNKERSMKILLKRLAYVATCDDESRELRDADVLVDGPSIEAVGRNLSERGVDRAIDGRGMIATPGLINAHQHLYQASMRAIPALERATMPKFLATQDAVGREWWNAGKFGAKTVGAVSRAVLAESVLGGVTTVADQHLFFPGDPPEPYVEATIEAASEIGVRFHACRGTVTLGRARGGMVDDFMTEKVEDVVRHAKELIDLYHDPTPFAMVRVALAPSGALADVPEVFDAFAALAEEHEAVRLHTHLYHREDALFARKRYGKSPWQLLKEHRFATDGLWVAHAVTAPEEVIAEFAEAGIAVAHITAADLKLGWGLAPLREYLDAGIPVGFGTTGSATNDGANMLGDLRVASLSHRAAIADPERWPTARELLGMATRGSAACLGRPDLGAIVPGMAADIACWDLTGVDRIGVHDPVAGLLMTGLSDAAQLVLVNGEVVVKDGRLVRLDPDEAAIAARAALPSYR